MKIKNMVCDRCIMSVRHLMDESGIAYESIDLGRVVLTAEIDKKSKVILAEKLSKLGFELLLDKESQYIEAVKVAVIKMIFQQQEMLKKFTVSAYIENEIGKDYKWLSTLFSKITGGTIEQYVIDQKVERVKELLSYNEMTITEIADSLFYSSVAHLSNQFKKVTGQTPSEFKLNVSRKALNSI